MIHGSRPGVTGTRARCGPGLVALSALALASCGGSGQDARPAPGPPQVGYVVVRSSSVEVPTELTGRAAAYEEAQVRPQVSGVIRSLGFTQGAIVRKGQTLYRIDPSLYQAATQQAQANVANASASREAARVRAQRYKPLAEMQAISQQDYTDAVAAERQANAQIDVNRAQLETARINLRYTRVPSPITGRIGRSMVTTGALVTANQPDPLATIQRLDPIYVDLQQSSAELLALRRSLATDGAAPATAAVELTLGDGSRYGNTGRLQFTESVVDPETGTVTLRATFPNPQGLLLPGMFVRARIVQQVDTDAILVPQQAVTRDPQGNATVLVVGAGDKAELRPIKTSRTQGANWIVTDGLKPGDKVITQGTGKARPGQPVKPVPASTPQRVAPPPRAGPGAAEPAGQ